MAIAEAIGTLIHLLIKGRSKVGLLPVLGIFSFQSTPIPMEILETMQLYNGLRGLSSGFSRVEITEKSPKKISMQIFSGSQSRKMLLKHTFLRENDTKCCCLILFNHEKRSPLSPPFMPQTLEK